MNSMIRKWIKLVNIRNVIEKHVLRTPRRRRYYVAPSLQLKYVLTLVFGVGIESLIVGGGLFYCYLQIEAFPPEQRLGMIYLTLLAIFLVLTGVNIVLGLLFSHRVAGPLEQIYSKMKEVGKGNLCTEARFREKDELQALEHGFNSMVSHLRHLATDNLAQKEAVLRHAGHLKKQIEGSNMPKKQKEECEKLLDELHSRILQIGNKFVVS